MYDHTEKIERRYLDAAALGRPLVFDTEFQELSVVISLPLLQNHKVNPRRNKKEQCDDESNIGGRCADFEIILSVKLAVFLRRGVA